MPLHHVGGKSRSGVPITQLNEFAIEWDSGREVCLSAGGLWAVLWASGAPVRAKRCCTLFGALAARWYDFAPRHWVNIYVSAGAMQFRVLPGVGIRAMPV